MEQVLGLGGAIGDQGRIGSVRSVLVWGVASPVSVGPRLGRRCDQAVARQPRPSRRLNRVVMVADGAWKGARTVRIMEEAKRIEPPVGGSEVETLRGFLTYQRATFRWKTQGLSRVQLAA